MSLSIRKFRICDKEIRNPVLRILAAILIGVFLASLIYVVTLVLIAVPIVVCIIASIFIASLPLNLVLRLLGRRGFYSYEKENHTWIINRDAFELRR